ncbi:xanthine dehydrogenase family protein molybdopterin-binding subunit [Gluconacetobacter azotocaptans]|uniref:Xanthine dehydrogenase family protein molybdopterin-binding subunit n=2 Tax=Gluconacetobacter azotocaptans TaxID=142834 RepID=A0A7W4JV53_9PROT|nr:molybdopterin cofactor-binding domain-containing protein [Gluconacetobacter azotocaptans]MBB2191453.1 xanthine dehydrogenase family protein molybdopterin-binding subunit [Gluconacetobacter azotocaptans]GBQ29631.1 aldehyde dehydrogenase large subunit [Gluconacetobacter azotocaptans DSM 13594]
MSPSDGTGLTRRRLLAGGGLVLAFAAAPRARGDSLSRPDAGPVSLGGFVRIGVDDTISLVVPNIEMGQGIYTAEAMLIAEELEVTLEQVRVVTALPQDLPAAPPELLRTLSTGGSKSIRKGWRSLREAGAAARMMLLTAAAGRWGVPVEALRAQAGVVSCPARGLEARYGALAEAAGALPVPTAVPLRERSAWRLIGRPVPRLDVPDKTTGRAMFGIDLQVPDMGYGAVSACPVPGGTLARMNEAAARAVPGVTDVVSIGTAVCVVARRYWAAQKGLAALDPQWDGGANARLSSADLMQALRQGAAGGTAVIARDAEGIDAALSEGGRRVEAVYELPFLAHAAMEPINVTIHLRADGCDVWAGTQVPTRARQIVARLTGLPPGRVAIHNQMIGGGFGRRLATDSIEQAVRFAGHLSRPVKFIWSREEDIRQDHFRPAYCDRMAASLGADGLPRAWVHHVTGGSVVDRSMPGGLPAGQLDHDAVAGAVDTPYDLGRMRVMWTRVDPPVAIGWWRGVGPAHNAYVVESFIDELAEVAGVDPVEYRRRLLGKNPRSRAVLDRVAREAGWGGPLPPGTGRGVSLHNAFGSCCAAIVEVSAPPEGALRIVRATVAVDCGIVVNPDTVRAQIEGGLLFGFSAALYGEITFANGRVEQRNFNDYRVMRINECPAIAVSIIPSDEPPGGIGEVGTVSAFPALGNAIYAATGQRRRRYPFVKSGV